MNAGILGPLEVVSKALSYSKNNDIPIIKIKLIKPKAIRLVLHPKNSARNPPNIKLRMYSEKDKDSYIKECMNK